MKRLGILLRKVASRFGTTCSRRGINAVGESFTHSKICVEISGDNILHWPRVRQIFVDTFQQYPLYRHFVPDRSKRSEFLRRYLDAVHEVSIRNKRSVLMVFTHEMETTGKKSVIGGSLVVRPCLRSGSWRHCPDEEYEDAYKKYRLEEVDREAMKRFKRYEAFESRHVVDKIRGGSLPTWYAMFYGIDAAIVGGGHGSNSFMDGVPLLYKMQKNDEAQMLPGNGGCLDVTKGPQTPVKYLYTKSEHSQELFQALDYSDEVSFHGSGNLSSVSMGSAFLILGITHCPRAANFHRKNGMVPVEKVPYHDETGQVPFDIRILYYDPFHTGAPGKIQEQFQK